MKLGGTQEISDHVGMGVVCTFSPLAWPRLLALPATAAAQRKTCDGTVRSAAQGCAARAQYLTLLPGRTRRRFAAARDCRRPGNVHRTNCAMAPRARKTSIRTYHSARATL